MAKLDYRYQSIDENGKIISIGQTLSSVQTIGKRTIIDYKLKRHCFQEKYPLTRQTWLKGFPNLNN